MKNRDTLKNIGYAFEYIYRCSPVYILLVILSALLTGAYKIGFIYMINILTKTVVEKNLEGFMHLSIVFFVLYIGILTINALAQNFILPVIENKIALDIQSDIYNSHILKPLSYTRNKLYLDNYYFSINHGRETLMGLINSVGAFASNLISVFGVSIIFHKYNAYLIIILFLGVFISFIISLRKEKTSYKKMEDDMPASREVYYSNQIFYQSEFQNEIRTSSTNIIFNILRSAFKEKMEVIYKWRYKLTYYEFLIKASIVISSFAVIFIIGKQTIQGVYSVSVFTMLFVGVNQINNDFGQFLSAIPHMYGLTLRIDKFRRYLENENINENYEIHKLELIKFVDVDFSYHENVIFKNLSIEIKCDNKIIHIKGYNGIGKSTFINLLVGLEKPCGGDIFYNDINLKNVNKNQLKKIFAIVYQDPQIYHLSIIQNIMLKSEYSKVDLDRVKEILIKLRLWDKIDKLENGVDTFITSEDDDRNSGFSKGELQKLAIARALFQDSECIILDEPFNYFDMESKKNLEEIITELSKTKTIFIISHIPFSKNMIKNSNILPLNMEEICN